MTKRILTFIVVFAYCVVLGGQNLLSAFSVKASAADMQGSDVLSDLKQDYTFNIDDYPVIQDSVSLQVIQIAESTQGEILIYVYQPNQVPGKYTASSINISAALHDSLNIMNYYLRLVDYDGVFQKYVVQGLSVPDGDIRYYDVVSIFRMFDATVDANLDDDNDNTIDEVVYKVAKQYIMTNTSSGLDVKVQDTEVVPVTDKFVGFVRYSAGFALYNAACDSHFVAFSTDRDIDELYEVDIFYTTQSYSYIFAVGVGEIRTYGDGDENTTSDIIPHKAYISHTQGFSYNGGNWGAQTYLRDRIQTSADFIATENIENIYECGLFNVREKTDLTDVAKENIESKQWVVRFAETDYTFSPYANSVDSTIVGDVSILRLKFATDGITYNLGVIDNKQTGSMIPSNQTNYDLEISDFGRFLASILGLIVLLVLGSYVMPFVSPIISLFVNGIGFILKFLLRIITLPFRLVGNLFSKR